MKNILLIASTSLILLLSGGCKKKKTETADPCANTVCLNGGTCVDGSCSCPTGYSGADCGTQKTPTKITISGVKVTNFPALSGTSTWDLALNTNPDIYAVIKKVGSTTPIITTGRIDEAPAGTPYVLPSVTASDVTDLVSQYNIELLDYDSVGSNDAMGNINFSIYSSTNKFPTTLTVTDGTVTFELTLSYTY